MKCKYCGKETDDVYTAYLQDRSKIQGLCKECTAQIERGDIDKITSECFEKLCQVVNGGSAQDLADSMIRTFQRQHRYLQNEFFLALWKFFEKYGSLDENHYDPRNEWAVKVASRWDKATFDGSLDNKTFD